jgi:dTDP-4-amino-4,6-dideoxygalactose transaminase
LTTPIPFIDLAAQRVRLGTKIDDAIAGVLAHGRFIHGPEVARLEEALAAFAGADHAVACASGTDALVLPLMAWGIGPGDAVFVPAFTFSASAEAVALLGATPVFVDVRPDTFNMEAESLTAAIAGLGPSLTARAVMPVDLFGQPADYTVLAAIAAKHGLKVLADSAQSFGARHAGVRTGVLGDAAGTSFFPAKPLGCYGDGGAVFTDDGEMAATLRSLRVHGQDRDKYDAVRIGLNSRLDTVQAAILLEKLAILEDEIEARNRVAARYAEGLAGTVGVPAAASGNTSVWAQYTIRTEVRDALAADLKAQAIPSAVYYRAPLHRQSAYRGFPRAPGGLEVSERLSHEVLSLPMHPYLTPEVQDRIIAAVRNHTDA